MARFLCIRRGALGDTLWMLPVLAAMRSADPSAELHFAGVSEYAGLLQVHGVVDRGFSTEDLELWSLNSDSAARERAQARLGGYTWIVADQDGPYPDSLAARVQRFDPRPVPGRGPAPAQVLDQLGLLGPGVDAVPRLPRRREPTTEYDSIVLHPGSGSVRKCWPWARWVELAHALTALGHHVVVALGEAEAERADLHPADLPSVVDIGRCVPLAGLAGRLEQAGCFVGNDAGPTHLAAALGIPTVAVFGPTDPAVCAPQGEHVTVVGDRTAGPPGVSVALVLAAVHERRR